MTTRAQATAAPHSLTIGGRALLFSPLTDKAIATYIEWIRGKHREETLKSIEGLEPEDRQALLRYAFDQRKYISMTSEITLIQLGTLEGVAKLAYLMVNPNHLGLSQEEVNELCGDPADAKQVLDLITVLYGPNRNGEGNVKKKTARRARKKKAKRARR